MAEAPHSSTPPPGRGPLWGGHTAGSGVVRQEAAGLDPLTRRLVRLTAGLSLLLILVVVNALLHGGESPFNPIAKAAQRTARLAGAKARIEAIYTSEQTGRSFTATGSAVFNARTGRSRALLSLSTPQLGVVRMYAVADGRTSFMRSRLFAGELPPGRRWLAVQTMLGQDQEAVLGASGGAVQQLSVLRSVSDDVHALGSERVGKVQTRRYGGTISLAAVADTAEEEGNRQNAELYRQLDDAIGAPIEAEVWIDGRGLLRRTRTVMPLPGDPGAPVLKMDMRTELYDFGVKPKIALPARREVFDATPIARAKLHMLNGSSLARQARPSRSEPLPAAEFRRRANRACRTVLREVRALIRHRSAVAAAMKRIEEEGVLDQRFRAAASRFGLRIYEPLYRLARRYLARAADIPPPAPLAAGYRRYVHNFAVQTEITLAEARIMEAGAFAEGKGLNDRKKRLSDASDEMARELGLPDCADDGSGSAGAGSAGAAS